MELWEIKQFGEKQEKTSVLPVTRQATGKLPPARTYEATGSTVTVQTSTGGIPKTIIVANKATPEEIKEKMEHQLRIQRAAHHQKRALEMKQQTGKLTIFFYYFFFPRGVHFGYSSYINRGSVFFLMRKSRK